MLAGDGQAALTLLLSGASFDLVLSDVVMPKMTGAELRTAINERWPELPVLLMSGYADIDVLPASEREGVINKPFQPGELVLALQTKLKQV
jgi:DNA-binding NtrC family response regulator